MSIQDWKKRNEAIFEQRLQQALTTALNGAVALVIVPASYPKQLVLNWCVLHMPEDRAHEVRRPGDELHFEGARGSVRVYDANHVEFDRKLKHLRGYPHGTATFLHPEIEES